MGTRGLTKIVVDGRPSFAAVFPLCDLPTDEQFLAAFPGDEDE